nr:MAG TPA: Receptor recognition protein, Long tail, Helical sandwich, Tail fiber [Caudoviricetes sp.]
MRNLSTEFKEQQNSGNRNYLKYADFTFTDGSTLSITDKDLWSNGFKFEDAVSQSGSFDIGAAIVNKLTLQINNFSGKYTDYIWDGARVVCYIGLELSTGIEKIRICTMTVTDAPYQSTAIISLTCEDSMRLFDRDYSESKLTYPATRLQIIQDACEVCGVTLQSTRFDNDDFVIQNRPDDSSITFRQVIAWVAQMGCQWAKCDEYGRLCFGWYEREVPDNFYDLVETPWKDVEGNDILDTTGEQIITIMQTGITAIQTNGFTPWLYDLEITGIKVTEYVENSSQNEAKTYRSGKSGYVIEISDNKLIQEGTGEEICKIISDRCVGMKFRPFSTGALTNIAWEAGDTIAISDRNGKQYKSYLTSVTLNPGAFEQLECSAKSVSRNKQKQYTLGQQVQAENKKNLKDERTAREKALEELSQRLAESSGTYTTVETQPDGSNIYYLHNKPQLSDSDIIWKMTAEAWAVSTDGGQHWNGGMTVDGDVIARILTATGVNADWINTGTIKAIDKDGNTTFLVDVTTGRVVINADSVQIKGKDVNAIAKEKAETEVNNFISNTYTTDINNLQSQIDGKIETWYQPNDPSVKWTKTEEYPWCDIDGNKILDESGNEIVLVWESEKAEHEGDLWHNTTDNTQWIYKSGIWQPQSIPNELLDKIDGKSSVYMIQPTPPYYEGDLWVTTNSEGKASLKTSFVNRINGDFTASDWIDFKYADKDDIKNAIDNYDTSLGQDEVFNKLTKGGTEQGIYIEDGKVYINAKYILAGLLAGERINGRGLKVINDDKNVTLEIDSKGNVILAPKTFSLQGKTVKEIADSSASTAVSGQTQADIFNKLTNGGKAQGIYLDENGNLYVNGEYVQAKGIRVVDSNGKTTFAIDKETGAVTIAASQFTLGDKSVTDIAQEEAIKQVQDITSDNIIKGYYLTEQNVKDYWSTQSAYTYEYGVQDVDGGKNAIKINGTGAQFGTKNYKPIKVTGNYTFSFWIKTSVATQVYVYLGSKTILNAKTTTEWKRLQVTTTLSSLPNDSLNSLRILTSSVGSSVKYDTYIYMPKLEYAYTNEQVFNMLTNNGAIKGMYMENGELYFSFTYAHGGTLKLGGSNNGNGLLSILNASGTQVGYIDNTGVHFNQGEFSGSVKSLTGEIGNWQIDKTNGKLTSANGAIVLDAKNNMVTINGVDLKANGSGFVIDGGIKIRNPLSGFGDATNFFCLENMGNITDGTHLGINSDGMVIKVPSSSWRYKSIRTTVKEEELEELYRAKVVWAKYKEGYLDKNDSRYDKLMPMFLAEDMERRFPIAVNHLPDGKPEDWNYRIMIPSMFAMIKFNHEKIKELKCENEKLKSELKSIKEELAEIKQLLGKSI